MKLHTLYTEIYTEWLAEELNQCWMEFHAAEHLE
jgi:hypothetical protein